MSSLRTVFSIGFCFSVLVFLGAGMTAPAPDLPEEKILALFGWGIAGMIGFGLLAMWSARRVKPLRD